MEAHRKPRVRHQISQLGFSWILPLRESPRRLVHRHCQRVPARLPLTLRAPSWLLAQAPKGSRTAQRQRRQARSRRNQSSMLRNARRSAARGTITRIPVPSGYRCSSGGLASSRRWPASNCRPSLQACRRSSSEPYFYSWRLRSNSASRHHCPGPALCCRKWFSAPAPLHALELPVPQPDRPSR